ncbi:MAG: pseudaminic acid biosynthesis-associated methylase [Alphaproteobacteria bacterium]
MSDDHDIAPQLAHWRGEFGHRYQERNAPTPGNLASLTKMWARMLRATTGAPPRSILEVGANIGLNLRVLPRLTQAMLYAVEPNAKARKRLVADAVIPPENVFDGWAAKLPLPDCAVDLVFTCGVLIHIAPEDLAASCREIDRVAARYVLCIEYFADRERMIEYHGQSNQLFLRDYGQFWLDTCAHLSLVDYGFFWKGAGCIDNLTWWLFVKSS